MRLKREESNNLSGTWIIRRKDESVEEVLSLEVVQARLLEGTLSGDDEAREPDQDAFRRIRHIPGLSPIGALLARAREQRRSLSFDESIQTLERVVAIDNECGEAHFLLALCFGDMQNYERACEYYDRCIELGYRKALAYNNQAVLWIYRNEAKHALENLRKAVELDPSLDVAHYNLAQLYRHFAFMGFREGPEKPVDYQRLADEELQKVCSFPPSDDASLLVTDIPSDFGAKVEKTDVKLLWARAQLRRAQELFAQGRDTEARAAAEIAKQLGLQDEAMERLLRAIHAKALQEYHWRVEKFLEAGQIEMAEMLAAEFARAAELDEVAQAAVLNGVRRRYAANLYEQGVAALAAFDQTEARRLLLLAAKAHSDFEKPAAERLVDAIKINWASGAEPDAISQLEIGGTNSAAGTFSSQLAYGEALALPQDRTETSWRFSLLERYEAEVAQLNALLTELPNNEVLTARRHQLLESIVAWKAQAAQQEADVKREQKWRAAWNEGIQAQRDGRLQAAEAAFEEAIAQSLGASEETRRCLREIFHQKARELYGRALAAEEKGELSQAVSLLQEAIKLVGEDYPEAKALYEKVRLKQETIPWVQQQENAFECRRKALAADDAFEWMLAAIEWEKYGRWSRHQTEATTERNRCLKKMEEKVRCLKETGLKEKALEILDNLLSHFPDQDWAIQFARLLRQPAPLFSQQRPPVQTKKKRLWRW